MKQQIRDYLSVHVGDHELKDDDPFFEMGLVNSLFAMQLALFIEQEFAVVLDGNDLDFKNFRTIDAIADLVGQKLGQA